MKKDEYIEEVLNSLNGLKTAEANLFFATRVFSKIEQGEKDTVFRLKPAFASFALGSLLLLLGLNIYFLTDSNSSVKNNHSTEVSEFQSEYFSYTNYNY
ncbi:MAG: hypothetical protein IAF38_18120 [Bacteroidia bacterium]|nr:hypothetical protein [Bacteroidia bacterium]